MENAPASRAEDAPSPVARRAPPGDAVTTKAPLPLARSLPPRSPAAWTVQIDFPQHSSALLETLNRHRLEGKFCDVSLLVQGRELRAHKAVLAAASPYFHDKLLLGDAARLTLPSVIEADAFEGLLQLIYSGRLLLPLDALPAHLLVASGLQMWQVVDKCSAILRELEASGGGISGRRGAACPTLPAAPAPSAGASAPHTPVQPLASAESCAASTESPVGGEGSELGEVLQIQVKEEEEEEEERWAAGSRSQAPPPPRESGEFPRAHGSCQPKPAPSHRLPEGESQALEPPAPPAVPPQSRRDSLQFKGVTAGGGVQSAGAKEQTKVLPGGDTEGNGELRFLLSSGAGATTGGEGGGGGGPSWKPVDLHGNEILSGGGGPGGAGQAVHGPVKLGGAPPADGKRFGCLCGKRFAVKPKRDRHIMLTFSLRPFGCGICDKRFKLKHHLTEHMKTHAGALHDCPYCGRQFRVHACYLRHRDLCKGQGWSTAHWTYK